MYLSEPEIKFEESERDITPLGSKECEGIYGHKIY